MQAMCVLTIIPWPLYTAAKKSKTTSKSSWRGEFWSDNQMDSDSLLQMTCCTGPMRCCFRPRKTERISTQKDYPCRPVSRTHQLSATSHGWMKSDPCSPQQEFYQWLAEGPHTRTHIPRSACAKLPVIFNHLATSSFSLPLSLTPLSV